MKLLKILGFAWALPLTFLGFVGALVGKCKYLGFVDGVFEFEAYPGGLVAWFFKHTKTCGSSGMWGCIAFYGQNARISTFYHERRHAEQAMVLGILWPVVYLIGGLHAWGTWLDIRAFYWYNPLEIDARRAELR